MDAEPNRNETKDSIAHQADLLGKRDRVWEIRFVWFLMIAIAALAGYHYLYSRVNDTIRSRVAIILAKKLPNHLVRIDSAHLESGRGLVLEGLRIAIQTHDGPRVIARIPRMILRGPMELVGLAQGDIPVESIFLDAIELSVWPMEDGQWSVQTLTSREPLPANIPPVEIRRGIIRLGQTKSDPSKETIFHDLSVSMRSTDGAANDNQYSLTEQTDSLGSILSSQSTKVELADGVVLQASVSSSYFSSLQMKFGLSRDKKQWSLGGSLKQLSFSSQLLDRVPEELRPFLEHVDGFTGHGTASFSVRKTANEASPQFEVHATVASGRLQHRKLPYPLEDLTGALYCRNNLLQIRQVSARSGKANFELETDLHGFTAGAPLVAKLVVKSLPLDERLYNSLPAVFQDQWRKVQVAGEVDATVGIAYDGTKWTPTLDILARNGSVNADVFPYPVSQIQGNFTYRDGVLLAPNLVGKANGETVRGSLKLVKAVPRWSIDFSVQSDGPVPIDTALVNALTPRDHPETSVQRFVRSLTPSGTVHVEKARFVRTIENPDHLSKDVDLSFYNGAIRYSEFRYPIFDVQGKVYVNDSSIALERIRGRNDSARIQCEGQCDCTDGNLSQLRLDFDVANVPLEEELHAALPASVRHLWNHLRPSGVIDRVLVTLERHSATSPLDLAVLIQEDGKVDPVAGRCVTLQPQSLPYLLNDVSCELSYRPGVVEIRRFGASHDSSQVRAEGTCRVHPDGTWGGLLSWIPTTRVIVDQNLLVSLPEYLRVPLAATEFRGPLGITGQTLIASDARSGEPSVKAWDLQIEVEDGQLAGRSLASGIRGTLQIQGENRIDGPIAKGYMDIDSLAIRNVPMTRLTGPFAIADSKLRFGRLAKDVVIAPISQYVSTYVTQSHVVTASAEVPIASNVKRFESPSNQISNQTINQNSSKANSSSNVAANPSGQASSSNNAASSFWRTSTPPLLDIQSEDLHANSLSGTVHMYGIHPLIEGQTELQVVLQDADLHGLLADLGESNPQAQGRLWVQCKLVGSLMYSNTLGGAGNAWLRDANFFEMPTMLRLFRVLSVKPPDDGAFESADVEFRIDGDRVPIDRISLDGDVLSLRGSGWTNLRKELQLDLYAYVGRRSALAAMFGPLVSQNDSATMLQVEVTGTSDNPQFRRSFPLMGNSLQQVFPERVSPQSK
ncbi:MAG: hypothetical protein NTW52_11165 [Planctomycetota bacterium]|nr:hypothetical protein [Planctomycetota bacterium]